MKKKVGFVILSVFLVLTLIPALALAEATVEVVIPGDGNNNKEVDIVDLTTAVDVMHGELTGDEYLKLYDLNNNNRVDIVDITTLVDLMRMPNITGVSVVDGTDGYTPVKTPAVGQKLTANIETDNETIGSYPVNPDAKYTWHYEGSDAVLGSEAVYTVTEDNVGKVLCVDVSVDGYNGTATWTAEGAVA